MKSNLASGVNRSPEISIGVYIKPTELGQQPTSIFKYTPQAINPWSTSHQSLLSTARDTEVHADSSSSNFNRGSKAVEAPKISPNDGREKLIYAQDKRRHLAINSDIGDQSSGKENRNMNPSTSSVDGHTEPEHSRQVNCLKRKQIDRVSILTNIKGKGKNKSSKTMTVASIKSFFS